MRNTAYQQAEEAVWDTRRNFRAIHEASTGEPIESAKKQSEMISYEWNEFLKIDDQAKMWLDEKKGMIKNVCQAILRPSITV